MTNEQIEGLKKLAEAASPGAWRWEMNESSKSVALVGGRPAFDKTVMDFTRWGLNGAAPRFNDAVASGEYNIMERAEKYAAQVPGREHHANWFKTVTHPDAAFIAAANPAAIKELLSELTTLRAAASAPKAELTDEQARQLAADTGLLVGDAVKFSFNPSKVVNYARAVLAQAAPVADLTAKIESLEKDVAMWKTEADRAVAWLWHDGPPPHPWKTEWFIAHTIYGDKVVLRALEKEHTYDYTTADGTYMMERNIKRWAQFPDSMYVAAPAAPVAAAVPQPVPLASFTGTMIEIGDMKAGRGFAVEIAEDTYVEVVGLTEAEVTNVAAQFYASVTIQVFPAAPAPDAGSVV